MRTRAIVLLLLACIVVVLTGCATTDPLTLPELTLVDMRLLDVTLFETTAEIKVRVTNPELEPMVLEGGVMRL
ncbi:MAG: hypothetical protein OEQ13_02435, partial [Acidobacteriota bacterium]|nr:hypothetical protein [Acidobacteriota bacterium]